MKYIYFFLGYLLVSYNSFAQSDSNYLNLVKDVKLLKENASKPSSLEIGRVQLLQIKNVTLFDANKKITSKRITVDSVLLVIQDGYVVNVEVFSGRLKFSNKILIGLNPKRFMKKDFLYDRDDKYCLIFQELVGFASYANYLPDDTKFFLSANHPMQSISKGIMLGTVLDLRLYTDAAALIANQKNGLIQIDARTKFYLTQNNVHNGSIFLFHYFKANLSYSKFDSKSGFVTADKSFSRSALLQNGQLNVELAFNMTDLLISRKSSQSLYFDLLAGVASTRLARTYDSTTTHPKYYDTIPIISKNLGLEIGLNLRGSENFGITPSIRGFWNFSPQSFDFETLNKGHFFIKASLDAYYYLNDDRTNRLFAKVNYFTDTKTQFDKEKNFLQFQIGYSANLSKVSSPK